MDDQLFRRLAAGARFRTRPNIVVKSGDASPRTRKAGEAAPLPRELDFFAKPELTGPENDTKPPKKKKRVAKKTDQLDTDQKIGVFRKKHHIRVYGSGDVAAPARRFTNMHLAEPLIDQLEAAGLKKPTPVQMQAIPVLLSGRDAFVVAPTGSGKTLVFVLYILSKLSAPPADGKAIRALVVSPTRELAHQIRDEFRRFTPPANQKRHNAVLLNKAVFNSWKAKAPASLPAVLVTTPQRLVAAVEDKLVDLSTVEQLVMDEADRLLEMGMLGQIDDILAACTHPACHKVLLSATIPSGVEDLARSFMSDDPVRVVVGQPNAATATIQQELLYVGQEEGKLMAIQQMLTLGGLLIPPVIIFAETIERAQQLFAALVKFGAQVAIIHSSRSQAEREQVIAQFREGRIWFLITTELLARGLDFAQVNCVINYDFPASAASYIHRIGRTGRAGREGKAITFFTRDDTPNLRVVVNVMRESGCAVPDWILALVRKKN